MTMTYEGHSQCIVLLVQGVYVCSFLNAFKIHEKMPQNPLWNFLMLPIRLLIHSETPTHAAPYTWKNREAMPCLL